jgi:hypothetical protein
VTAPFEPVSVAAFLRSLNIIRQELAARDVRGEIGGDGNDDERSLSLTLAQGWRIVARFENTIENREQLGNRLTQLCQSLFESHKLPEPPRPPKGSARTHLDVVLRNLAERAGALRAVVLDARSPVLWGLSERVLEDEDVPFSLDLADAAGVLRELGTGWDEILAPSRATLAGYAHGKGTEAVEILLEAARGVEDRTPTALRQLVLTACAIAALRDDESGEEPNRRAAVVPGRPFWARSFASIYWLLLIFDGPYSELHAEAALLHLLPTVEQLVTALPPLEPPPTKARVMRFSKGTN